MVSLRLQDYIVGLDEAPVERPYFEMQKASRLTMSTARIGKVLQKATIISFVGLTLTLAMVFESHGSLTTNPRSQVDADCATRSRCNLSAATNTEALSAVHLLHFPQILRNRNSFTWQFIGPSGIGVKQVVPVEDDLHTIFAVADRIQYPGSAWIYKSSDGGVTWNPLTNGLTGHVETVSINSREPELVLAGTVATTHGVSVSYNAGETWQQTNSPANVRIVASSPISLGLWIAGSYNPLIFGSAFMYRTVDSGMTWNRVTLTTTVVSDIIFDPNDSQHAFACDARGVLQSWDAGQTWIYSGLDKCDHLLVDLDDPAILFVAIANEIFRTNDNGLNWSLVLELNGPIVSMVQQPPGSAHLYTADATTVMASADGGNHWFEIPRSYGVELAIIQDLAVDSTNIIYLATDIGIWALRQ